LHPKACSTGKATSTASTSWSFQSRKLNNDPQDSSYTYVARTF
jgi:hypothetical protein